MMAKDTYVDIWRSSLARTADPAHLDRFVRVQADRPARLDQVAGDAVVAAAFAQG